MQDRGWLAIPVDTATKRPLVEWKELIDGPWDEEVLERVWAGHLDATGLAFITGPRTLVALDADTSEAVDFLLDKLDGAHVPAFGSPRGLKLLYRHPGGELASCAGEIHPGVDLLADSHLLIVPPSVGREWWPSSSLDDLALPPLPKWALTQGTKDRRRTVRISDEPIPEGQRNDELTRIGGKLLDSLGHQELVVTLEALNQTRCKPPLDADEVRGIVKSLEGYRPPDDADEQNVRDPERSSEPDRTMTGGSFALDVPDLVDVTLWGRDSQVLWIRGEPFLIVGPTGACKTTLAWNLVMSLVGLRAPELLGLPVRPIEGRVLYIAADRPDQARRALRRMVTEEDRATLDERLSVWRGPLLFDVTRDPDQSGFVRQGAGR